jgi:hypothetical protein
MTKCRVGFVRPGSVESSRGPFSHPDILAQAHHVAWRAGCTLREEKDVVQPFWLVFYDEQ